MNWAHLQYFPWLDKRAHFVAATPIGGALLDLGTSNGETLCHMAELRPDLRFFAVDKEGPPQKSPTGCEFHRVEKEKLPWPDSCMDAITCIHLVEHLNNLELMMQEIARVLKPGGRAYIETPHPKSLVLSSSLNTQVPLNFFDDLTHVRVVTTGALAHHARKAGLQPQSNGTARNWLFAATRPFFSFSLRAAEILLRVFTGWDGQLT